MKLSPHLETLISSALPLVVSLSLFFIGVSFRPFLRKRCNDFSQQAVPPDFRRCDLKSDACTEQISRLQPSRQPTNGHRVPTAASKCVTSDRSSSKLSPCGEVESESKPREKVQNPAKARQDKAEEEKAGLEGDSWSARQQVDERDLQIRPLSASLRTGLHEGLKATTATSRPTQLNTTFSNKRTTLLVCTGVDCKGMGSGSVLTEIEELCSELRDSNVIDLGVSRAACSLQCAMAPVVTSWCSSAPAGSAWLHSYAKVDTSTQCASIVNEVVQDLRRAEGETGASVIPAEGLLQRRAGGVRMRALRLIARKGKKSQKDGKLLLRRAHDLETEAARGDEAQQARAMRRASRLGLLRSST